LENSKKWRNRSLIRRFAFASDFVYFSTSGKQLQWIRQFVSRRVQNGRKFAAAFAVAGNGSDSYS
jgi:hypothetical protein